MKPSLATSLLLALSAVSSSGQEPLPSHPPTVAEMRALGGQIAAGETGALERLENLADQLYRDIDYKKERDRVQTNLVLMRAAFTPIGEAAGAGKAPAFAALQTCLGTRHLSSFAPTALGAAAAAGHEGALDILLNYPRYGILESTATFALFEPARKKNEKAVAFLVGSLAQRGYREVFSGTTQALLPAAMAGNAAAKAALDAVAEAKKTQIPRTTDPR